MATAEQRAQLIAALSDFYKKNWAQIAPGDAGASETDIAVRSERLANSFVEKAEAGDKSVYSGEQPLETFALNADGTGINPEAQDQLILDAAVHHADADAAAQAPIAPTQSDGTPDTGMTISGTEAELRNDPAPQPAEALADGATAPNQEQPEQPAETAPEGGDNAAGTEEPTAAAPTGPFNWDTQKWVYAPYSDGQEAKAGNGNADKDNVHKITDIKFYDLSNYETMRQLAVYYGGYERDPKFRTAVEKFAAENDTTVAELLNPTSERMYGPEGKKLNGQHTLHEIYKQNSLLLGNALEQDGGKFELELKSARLIKKSLMDKLWSVDQGHVDKQTDNKQLAYGSNVLFSDSQGSIYKDNGQSVSMIVAQGQPFGAEHAINIARIYMSARQKPPVAQPVADGETPKQTDPQRIKFVIGSGLGMIHDSASRALGNKGEYARRRDLMILSALHQGARAGMVPDLFVKGPFGLEQSVGKLDIKDMNEQAKMEFTKMGINVQRLVDYHNSNIQGQAPAITTDAFVSGEDAIVTERPAAAPASAARASEIIMARPPETQDTPTVTPARTTPARPARPAGPAQP